jgi:hypothetical protein
MSGLVRPLGESLSLLGKESENGRVAAGLDRRRGFKRRRGRGRHPRLPNRLLRNVTGAESGTEPIRCLRLHV